MQKKDRSMALTAKPAEQEKATGRAPEMTHEELLALENRSGERERRIDRIVLALPFVTAVVAALEYLCVPDKYPNEHPERYLILIGLILAVYLIRMLRAFRTAASGDRSKYRKLRHKAPHMAALFLLFALLDVLTLKSGILLYPFIPWLNDILNAAIDDWAYLLKSALFSLRLLFIGYFAGAAVGLITGIACGYNKKVRYWIDPLLKVLGPIPTATWVPLVMILAASLFRGAVFIIALGVWFAVSMATITGITTIDPIYFDAAKTLGANDRQMIFNVAIPHAMPSILQGMTQGMSSACVSLVIAEMLGVESGLGWYITWSKAWATYNRMFAAIIIICFMFNIVTKALELVKARALRWQK